MTNKFQVALHVCAFALLSAVGSRRAVAAPGDATHLEYARSARAAGCPDREALKTAVQRRLGYDPFFPVARQSIVVEVSDFDDTLRARMQLLDEQGMIIGSRELSDRLGRCDDLIASLALAISIALDPSAALGSSDPPAVQAEPRSQTGEPAEPVLRADVEPAPLAKPSVDRKPKPTDARPGNAGMNAFGLQSSVFEAFGTAPAEAFGFRIGPNWEHRWFRLSAELVQQFPASQTETTWSSSVKASLTAGSLAPCVAWKPFAACVVLEVGVLRAQGQNVERATKLNAVYASLGGRIEYSFRLYGDLQLLLSADVARPLTPLELQLRGQTVWQTPALAAVAAAGLKVRFPRWF